MNTKRPKPPVPERCECGNEFDGDNLCMVSACQWEGLEDQRTRSGQQPDPAGQTVDVDTLVRAMLDVITYRWSTADEMTATAFATACYLSERGVVLTLGGQPFSPAGYSIHTFQRLCERWGLMSDG